jgi:RNA polymerase sigma factor (TIGR02999 family)
VGSAPPPGEITTLLDRWAQGDAQAFQALTPYVYEDLRRLARSFLRKERSEHTLQATGLVNELYLILLKSTRDPFHDRSHFFSFAARAMRRILVDHARARATEKRGTGIPHLELSPEISWIDPTGPEMLDVDRLLDELETLDPRKARAVELRIFLGCTAEEAAELLSISKPTLDRDLRFSLAWLAERLLPPSPSTGS